MMRINKLLHMTLLSGLLVSTAAMADALTPQDFAYGIKLETGKQSLQQFELPLHVLQHGQHANYADVRLFDAAGNTLPFEIRATPQQSETTQQTLPFIPLDKDKSESSSDIVLKLNQASDRQHIEISTNQPQQPAQTNNAPKQYILLNPNQEQKLCALTLDWQPQAQNRLLSLQLESSQHLKQWRTIAKDLVLTQMQHADTKLESKKTTIPCTQAAYLRLTWANDSNNPNIQGIEGHYTQTQAVPTAWTPIPLQADADNPKHLLFDNPGIAAINSLRLQSAHAEQGFIVEGKLYSRTETPPGKQERWVYRGDLKQYRLHQDGETVQSAPMNISATRDPFWKIELTQAPINLPKLDVSWTPEQIVFIAQGQAPYTLAYGNASVTELAHSRITRQLNDGTKALQAETATLGTPFKLGNIQNGDDFPWKQILMWLTLMAGTGLMAYMAYSLFRQLPKDEN